MSNVQTESWMDRTVGEVVAENYGRAAAFTRLGIDFCCGGKRTVAQACAKAGVPAETAIAEIEAADRAAPADSDDEIRAWPAARLSAHIVDTHHDYVRRTLPVLGAWSEKVARVHGERHPELLEVRTIVATLQIEMTRHMRMEEDHLFPRLEVLDTRPDELAGDPTELIIAMEDDHDEVGGLMRRAREVTAGFDPPEGACATYRATFALLEEFETDLHRHVHLENNLLFPAARRALAGHEPVARG
ncbi:MAG: iron-sulfur cluster repair di-iron protein [Longimicrobiales bacterium]|nr:iron-sulfur cluster repair di-iron protein [Longimicrobiales bacterium]